MDFNNSIKVCIWDNCLAQFSDYEDLYKHLKEVHVNSQNPSLPRDCRWANTCNYQTSEKKHLVSHLRSHLDWRPYSCELCDSRFKHEHEISRHVAKLHKQPSDSDYTLANQVSPPSFSNNVTSNDSFFKAASTSPSNMQYSESDLILSEIIEFAFGFRPFLRMDDGMKSNIMAMGLSPHILDIPQHQLRRSIIDNLYQSLLVSSYSNSDPTALDNNPMSSMGYTSSNYALHSEYIPQAYNQPGLALPFNNQGQVSQENLFQNQTVMSQHFNAINNSGYCSEQINQFQLPGQPLGYNTQMITDDPVSFSGYSMGFTTLGNLEGSTIVTTRSISNQGQFTDSENKSPKSTKLPESRNSNVNSASPKDKGIKPLEHENLSEYSPLSKFGVRPLFSSILPSIKNFLTTSSSSSSPEVDKEIPSLEPEPPLSSEEIVKENIVSALDSDGSKAISDSENGLLLEESASKTLSPSGSIRSKSLALNEQISNHPSDDLAAKLQDLCIQ